MAAARAQDYGYWYGAYVFPRLISCFIAIDRATQANGALTVLRGSHACGRIEHVTTRGQPGGEPQRLALLEAQLDQVVCEMEAGDVLWFHCNTL